MPNGNLIRQYVAHELNLEVLAELEAERLRRLGDAIVELLYCQEKLRRLHGANLSCGRMSPNDRRV